MFVRFASATLETERLQQESLLKLQQEEEERIEREAEDENMFQAAEYKKRVEAERRRRLPWNWRVDSWPGRRIGSHHVFMEDSGG